MNNLATLYEEEGKYTEAEPLIKASLEIQEKSLGPEHPDVSLGLNNLALAFQAEGKYGEAEPLLLRSIAIREKAFGAEHPKDRKSTRLNSSHTVISYAVFCLKKKKKKTVNSLLDEKNTQT